MNEHDRFARHARTSELVTAIARALAPEHPGASASVGVWNRERADACAAELDRRFPVPK